MRVEVPKMETSRFGMVTLRSWELERSRRTFLRFSCSATQGKVYGKRVRVGMQRESMCFGFKGGDGRVRMGQARMDFLDVRFLFG